MVEIDVMFYTINLPRSLVFPCEPFILAWWWASANQRLPTRGPLHKAPRCYDVILDHVLHRLISTCHVQAREDSFCDMCTWPKPQLVRECRHSLYMSPMHSWGAVLVTLSWAAMVNSCHFNTAEWVWWSPLFYRWLPTIRCWRHQADAQRYYMKIQD